MIIIVDDEPLALEGTKNAVLSVEPDAKVMTFAFSRQALNFVRENNVDCAFLDISMPVISGVDLANKIKTLRPLCNIVFTTGFDKYYGDAFSLGASDYLLKPITPDKIKHALEQLRHPMGKEPENGTVYIKCFGNFEIFLDGAPIHFKRAKSKEMLAYIVSRDGAAVTKNELMANLFEKDDTSYYGVLKKDLSDTLDSLGIGEILIKSWKTTAVNKAKVKCDYFDFLSEHPDGLHSYSGEFMTQYSWAEFMHGAEVYD